MPSVGPVYFAPLVQARVDMTRLNDAGATMKSARDASLNFAIERDEAGTAVNAKPLTPAAEAADKDPKTSATLGSGIMGGFTGLQQAAEGAGRVAQFNFAPTDESWVANRVDTLFRNHPDVIDGADADQAAELTLKFAEQARAELKEHGPFGIAGPGMRMAGDTLEVSPTITGALKGQWTGDAPIDALGAAAIGHLALREIQRSVTQLAPDSEKTPVSWFEEPTVQLLSTWKGDVSAAAKKLGFTADAAEIEANVAAYRSSLGTSEPTAEAYRSVAKLLSAAGIDVASETGEMRDAVARTLQRAPLEGVPTSLADAIVASRAGTDPSLGAYVAKRIVETGGTEGNVDGLVAELDKIAPKPNPPSDPPPSEPAPAEPPKEEPPPAEQPPPAEEPPAEQPVPGTGPTAADLLPPPQQYISLKP